MKNNFGTYIKETMKNFVDILLNPGSKNIRPGVIPLNPAPPPPPPPRDIRGGKTCWPPMDPLSVVEKAKKLVSIVENLQFEAEETGDSIIDRYHCWVKSANPDLWMNICIWEIIETGE